MRREPLRQAAKTIKTRRTERDADIRSSSPRFFVALVYGFDFQRVIRAGLPSVNRGNSA